jgi:nucleoside-diphosphate-sugar epimerase
MIILITGANGYIGTRLTEIANNRGHTIIAASRSKPSMTICAWLPYELGRDFTISNDVDVVVHLATSDLLSNSSFYEDLELRSADKIINESLKINAKFIFISSQTARFAAPTAYGRSKFKIENSVLAAGGWVIRPGLVYGGECRGLFGHIVRSIKKFRVAPRFFPSPKVQPIHINDLSEAILNIVENDYIKPGIYSAGSPVAISFNLFLNQIARLRIMTVVFFVPIPTKLAHKILFILGKSVRVRLGLEGLMSLFQLEEMNTSNDLDKLKVSLRPLEFGMTKSGKQSKRPLLLEALAMTRYISKRQVDLFMLRNYAKAIEKFSKVNSLRLPMIFLVCPTLIAFLEDNFNKKNLFYNEFYWRLNSATLIYEATSPGSRRFLGLEDNNGVIVNLIRIVVGIISEFIFRFFGILFYPIYYFIILRNFKNNNDL